MRLVCPNCGAQYEVADDVIPTDGRDVQCSNCGHTWFESHGASDVEDAFADVPSAPSARTDDDTAPISNDDVQPETTPTAPVRQELDPAIADILREEAAREAEARQREAAVVESQPDLGLDSTDAAPDQRTQEVRKRLSTLKGEEDAGTAQATASAGLRRELLPDIEEINSSLRSDAERDVPATEVEAAQVNKRRGFRRGFFGVLLILAILVALYIFAPQISAAVPAVAEPLASYVEAVDQLRLWVDLKLQGFVAGMSANEA